MRAAGAPAHGASAREAATAMRSVVAGGAARRLAASTAVRRLVEGHVVDELHGDAGRIVGRREDAAVGAGPPHDQVGEADAEIGPAGDDVGDLRRGARLAASASASSEGERPGMPGRQPRSRSGTSVAKASGGPFGSIQSDSSGVPAMAERPTR